MSKRYASAPLAQALAAANQTFRAIEEGLWERITGLEERECQEHALYEKLCAVHSLVEDLRIDTDYALAELPVSITDTLVNYEVEYYEGRQSRRVRFDNAVRQLAAVREAAATHADRRSTPEDDVVAITTMLDGLSGVNGKIASVRFPA